MLTEAALLNEAWEKLEASILRYGEEPVGTVAAVSDPSVKIYNYGHCFVRDFVPSALAFLTKGRGKIVSNFLRQTLKLQINDNNIDEIRAHMDGARPGIGLMPASFEVVEENGEPVIRADYGERAIGRVTPVDSGLWWIILLRAYKKACKIANRPEECIAHRIEFQRGIQLILDICLSKRFDMTPTMLVPEAAFMIDRRMGVYGHPLEIQALFHHALRSARYELLKDEDYIQALDIDSRLYLLTQYIRERYWLDPKRVRAIYRYQTEEFGET